MRQNAAVALPWSQRRSLKTGNLCGSQCDTHAAYACSIDDSAQCGQAQRRVDEIRCAHNPSRINPVAGVRKFVPMIATVSAEYM
jgi:hypothetical protein